MIYICQDNFVSVAALVNNKLDRMKRGVPFSIENFYSLGSASAVQKTMSRLTEAGRLVRVAKGIYSRPKPLASIPNIKVTAKAEDVVKTWAKTYRYKIVPQGIESAYRLGMQTQAPIKVIYWTNGASREFRIGNELITVKHVCESKLRWANQPIGSFYRGLLSLSPEFTPISSLQQAAKRLGLSDLETKKFLDKLQTEPMLKEWKPKLIELRSSLFECSGTLC